MKLFDYLLGCSAVNHDGSSIEKAIVVDDIGEEYQWLEQNYPDFQLKMQMLKKIKEKSYDVHIIIDERGKEHMVYFDVSKCFGKFNFD